MRGIYAIQIIPYCLLRMRLQNMPFDGLLLNLSTEIVFIVNKRPCADPFVFSVKRQDQLQHIAMAVSLCPVPNSCVLLGTSWRQFKQRPIIFIANCVGYAYTFTQMYAIWTMSAILVFVEFVSKICLISMTSFLLNLMSILRSISIKNRFKMQLLHRIKQMKKARNDMMWRQINLNKTHQNISRKLYWHIKKNSNKNKKMNKDNFIAFLLMMRHKNQSEHD